MLLEYNYVVSDYVVGEYVGDFNITTLLPEYGASLEYNQRTLTYGTTYSQRAEDGINETSRVWNLSFRHSPLEIAFLENILSGYVGEYYFTWQPPTGSSATWVASDISVSEDGFNIATLSAKFKEIFI